VPELDDTLATVAFDLKPFFAVVGKDPAAVAAADAFDFLADQRGDRTVIRLADQESGLSARTIARRLSSVSGLAHRLVAEGEPLGDPSRLPASCPGRRARRAIGAPLKPQGKL